MPDRKILKNGTENFPWGTRYYFDDGTVQDYCLYDDYPRRPVDQQIDRGSPAEGDNDKTPKACKKQDQQSGQGSSASEGNSPDTRNPDKKQKQKQKQQNFHGQPAREGGEWQTRNVYNMQKKILDEMRGSLDSLHEAAGRLIDVAGPIGPAPLHKAESLRKGIIFLQEDVDELNPK